MLEALSELFYDPWVFWGVPLVLAVLMGLYQRRRRKQETPPDE